MIKSFRHKGLKLFYDSGCLAGIQAQLHNPPHPGELIREIYLEPFAITGRQLAAKLGGFRFHTEPHPKW